MSETRTVKDSMGALDVPKDALYGAQTQRAIENFPISGLKIPRYFVKALGLIKASCAQANRDLGFLEPAMATAILEACEQVTNGELDAQFPVDIFQTGSGTSSNMNANEVIARLSSLESGIQIHPNDHVNMCQSSNDVIPTAILVSSTLLVHELLSPALENLKTTFLKRAEELKQVTKTGRTHLMDAMSVTFAQPLKGYATQIEKAQKRLHDTLERTKKLSIGGTAVGTGINAPQDFGSRVCAVLKSKTGISFDSNNNYFEGIGTQDAAVELSGQLKVLAVSLMKMANDFRWMNSGPLAGLGEIALPALQPGSSIMPGKVNPVIPEAVAMVCAQVMGNDTTITVAGQSGNFELNVMLPVIGYNLLQSIEILGNAVKCFDEKAVQGFTVNEENTKAALEKNPILVTALNSVIGYEKGAEIAKKAYQEGKPVREVAKAMTDLSDEELDRLLDPQALTKGGIPQ